MEKKERVCLAVGNGGIEQWLKTKLEDVVTFGASCSYMGQVLTVVAGEKPDIVVISEELPTNQQDNIDVLGCIRGIKSLDENCRVIFIAGDRTVDDPLFNQIASLGYYDIAYGKSIQIADVARMILQKTDFSEGKKFLHFDNAEIEQKPVEAVEEKEVARRGIFGSKKVEDKKTEEKQETVIKTEENTTNKTSQENTDNIQTNTQDRTQDKTQADRSNVENNTLKGNSQLNEVKKQPVQNESATYIGGQIEVTTKTYKKKGIVFTEATENDFADFTQHNLPSPENFDGNHRRKEILYGDSNQSFSAPTKEQGVGAKIGVFAGVRQGVGCTSTAIDVAVALAKKDNKVLLLDFAGSIFKKLGIKGEWNGLETLTYWLNNGYNITNQTVTMNTLLKNERNQTGLPDKEINFSYMPKSLHFLETRLDTLGDITNVIRVLKTQYDYIIADVDLGYDLPPVRTLLSLADSVFCVTTQDMYEVNMLTECINSYKNTVNFANKARIIVNRYQKAELDVNYLKEIVQTDIVIGLNEDSANHLRASNSCMPYYLTTRKRKYLKNYELIINAI